MPFKQWRHRLEYGFFTTLTAPVKLLPPKKVFLMGNLLGDAIYVLGIRKRVVRKNLEIAFADEKTFGERLKIEKRVYRHLATAMLECLLLERLAITELRRMVHFSGLTELRQSFDRSNGVIYTTAHLGNWEIGCSSLGWSGIPMNAFVRRQSNPYFNQRVNAIRLRCGVKLIDRSKQSLLRLFKALKNNELVVIVGDLNVPDDRLFVNFFGKAASMGRGIPLMALRQQSDLFFGWAERVGPFEYRHFVEKINYRLTGDEEADLQLIAQRYSDHLQEVIRRIPEQYFWFNRRWKTRPPGDQERVYG